MATSALLAADPVEASFPGANGRIAYTSGDSVAGIVSVNPDGSGKLDLTGARLRGSATGSYDPAYSADGERITFEKVEPGIFRPDVFVMNADGSAQTNLTRDTTTDRESDPSFSPDGSQIAYVREPDGGNRSIVVMSSSGSAPTDLTSTLPITFPSNPEFSPDGTRIAFDASSGPDQDVYVMNANGTGLTNITVAVAGASSAPSWSPDGTRIAFEHSDIARSDIFLIGSSGGATTNLTSTLAADANPSSPAFSPDGSRIAYSRKDGADADIYVMTSADGLGQTNLTTDDPSYNGQPNWGPADVSAPQVTIGKGPKRKTSKRTAKLAFSADEPGVTFRCSLDGKGVRAGLARFQDCSSPRTYRRLRPGRKTFRVRGIDPAGNVSDQAKLKWKVRGSK